MLKKYLDILPEKKLYSPGPIPQSFRVDITFSHRSKEFQELYADTKKKLRERFNIPDRYNILFTQGSGTSAIETVLRSLSRDLTSRFFENGGTFCARAEKIAKQLFLSEEEKSTPGKSFFYYVQFETSSSQFTFIAPPSLAQYELKIVDCISGFGFYPLPIEANIIILSSSKILGGLPVLGIVLYDSKAEKYFIDTGDYLSIRNYMKYDEVNQTPHTSLIPQFLSLNKALDNPISREQIERNCQALHSDKIQFIGEKVAPVLTIKVENPKEWVEKFKRINAEIYFNEAYMTDYFQVSMFNYREPRYYELIRMMLDGEL